MQTSPGVLKKCAFLGIILFMPLVAAEGVARLVERLDPPRKPDLDQRLDRPVAAKPEGAFRVFVYGGSTVYGTPVPSFGFVAQLQHALGQVAPEQPYDVHNFGARGKSSTFVRKLVEATIDEQPDLLIVCMGHNEFLVENNDTALAEFARGFATTRVSQRLLLKAQGMGNAGGRVNRDRSRPWHAYDRESPRFRNKADRYAENLEFILALAKERDVPVLLMTVPANVRDWRPLFENVRGGYYDDSYHHAVVPLLTKTEQEPDAAKPAVAALQSRYPNDAMLAFLDGRLAMAAGDYGRARAAFLLAKEADPIPTRALAQINDTTRALAAQYGAALLDTEVRFAEASPHGLVGFELIADNVHPSMRGHALITQELLTVMHAQGWLSADLPTRSLSDALGIYLASFPEDQQQGLYTWYLLENARYAMRKPMSDFSTAKHYLDEAATVAPENAQVWANAASIAILNGKVNEGRDLLAKAQSLSEKPLDPYDGTAPRLQEAIAVAGVGVPSSG